MLVLVFVGVMVMVVDFSFIFKENYFLFYLVVLPLFVGVLLLHLFVQFLSSLKPVIFSFLFSIICHLQFLQTGNEYVRGKATAMEKLTKDRREGKDPKQVTGPIYN